MFGIVSRTSSAPGSLFERISSSSSTAGAATTGSTPLPTVGSNPFSLSRTSSAGAVQTSQSSMFLQRPVQARPPLPVPPQQATFAMQAGAQQQEEIPPLPPSADGMGEELAGSSEPSVQSVPVPVDDDESDGNLSAFGDDALGGGIEGVDDHDFAL